MGRPSCCGERDDHGSRPCCSSRPGSPSWRWVGGVLGGYGLAALMAVLAIKQLLAVGLAQLWLPIPWGGGAGSVVAVPAARVWLGAATHSA